MHIHRRLLKHLGIYSYTNKTLQALSKLKQGDHVNLMGPIGNGFSLEDPVKQPVMIGGGVGIPPVLFLAEYLKQCNEACQPIAFFGSELPFPFALTQSNINIAGVKKEINTTIQSMEKLDVACRLSSFSNFEGCYPGYVTELADQWLRGLTKEEKGEVIIYACGPEPMLAATSKLAYSHGVDCKLSLEEFMACAIGGCAGCTVKVYLPEGEAMKRVCVDGPVFDAISIYPNESD